MTSEANILKRAKTVAKDYGFVPIRCAFMPGVEGGWPDLMILGPGRSILFMETKRQGKKLTPLQARRRRQIEDLGHFYVKCDSFESVERALARFEVGAADAVREIARD